MITLITLYFFDSLLKPTMQELKNVGLKVTKPRTKILEFLQTTDKTHFTTEEVYDALRDIGNDIGLATVYRVLSQFEKAGILKKNSFDGTQAVYELADDAHHDHLICISCGKIVEFFDSEIEKRKLAIAKKHKFSLKHHELNLYGFCDACGDK